MSDYACIFLPFPVSVNDMFAGKARRYASPRYKDWQAEAGRALVKQGCLSERPMFVDPVTVILAFGRPDKRRRDLDNYAKGVLDILCRPKGCGVLEDDSLIHKLTLEWNPEVTGVRVEIEPYSRRAA